MSKAPQETKLIATWFELLRSAGIDPASRDWSGSPFETVAGDPSGEIVVDERTGLLWHLDHSGATDGDDPYDAPVRQATNADVKAMNARRERLLSKANQ